MIPLWLQYLLLALAVYRVAHMVALEDGPADAFARWRHRVGQRSWVGRGFHCPLCLSFWLGLLAALALPWTGWLWYGASSLALSGVTLALGRRH
jgi:hypothetical protein